MRRRLQRARTPTAWLSDAFFYRCGGVRTAFMLLPERLRQTFNFIRRETNGSGVNANIGVPLLFPVDTGPLLTYIALKSILQGSRVLGKVKKWQKNGWLSSAGMPPV